MTFLMLNSIKPPTTGLLVLTNIDKLNELSACQTPLEQFKVKTFARNINYHVHKPTSPCVSSTKLEVEHNIVPVKAQINYGRGSAAISWLSKNIIYTILPVLLILTYTVRRKKKIGILTPTLPNFINTYINSLTVNIIKSTVSIKHHPLSLVFVFHFLLLFILAGNLIGMLPGAFAVTAQLVITLWMSLSLFLSHNIISIVWNEEKFFRLFLPLTSPVVITFLIVPIEYISYFSRIFSLAIRLFANMMSGHVLLKILISFVFTGISANVGHWLWIWMPTSVVFLVIGLELVIAFLQAFVFVLLSLIYLNEAINIH